MKRRIFNIKGKRLVEGDANLTNQDEILVKELQDNRVALLENIDGKLVNIGGLEEEKEKRPEIVDTVVLARHHVIYEPVDQEKKERVERINLFLGKRNILQYKSNVGCDRYIIRIRDRFGTVIRTLSGLQSYFDTRLDVLGIYSNECLILTPYISNDTLNIAIEVAKDGYYELENVLDSNGERQLIQIRNGYCVTPFGGGVKPMRFKYPFPNENFNTGASRIWCIINNTTINSSIKPSPEFTSDKKVKYLHVLLKKNPLFTFDKVEWLDELSDEELRNHLISVKVSRTRL